MYQYFSRSLYNYYVKGSTIWRAPGFVNFVLALAYHFCLNLPAAFTQPGARLLAEPCRPAATSKMGGTASHAVRGRDPRAAVPQTSVKIVKG